ncbi:CpaF family protein [Marinobacterium weihaiense]|uniref:CpaF family protein n=1 Tax=Marinobacterium weihaiense TaxID=2851016 RepID=A0ABS6MB02_9GAMM|nr:CpaF family protein [Marinobacterium weihaiense]MBV0933487.1 CpaF family protein [Marinobacterium weihaiense]
MSLLSNRLNRLRVAEVTELAQVEEVEIEEAAVQERPPLMIETLSAAEIECKQQLHRELLKRMDLSLIDSLEEAEARRQISDLCRQLMDEHAVPFSSQSRQKIVKLIEDEIMGLGPLEPLLEDSTISDILVNGPDSIFVERFGKLEHCPVSFSSAGHLMNTIDRIVSSVGRHIDESSPMVDARLKDGSRVNVIIPPLALDGPQISIRRFMVELLSMENLIEKGSVDARVAPVLEGIVKARLNILISGGTGSGKTTLLNILSGYIPHDERIVTIEDSAELQLQQPHVVRLETRPPNIEGRGEVTQRDLVKNSLRMRPDRIVLGEVRGGETLDMLQAMNTGHDGSLTTIHANSARDALGRIENMVAMTGISFPTKALRAQIASAIDVVLQVTRLEDGRRKLVSIQEINGMEGDIITMSELFTFERQGLDAKGNVLGRFKATGIVPGFHKRLAQRGIDIPTALFEPE